VGGGYPPLYCYLRRGVISFQRAILSDIPTSLEITTLPAVGFIGIDVATSIFLNLFTTQLV